MTFFWEKYIIMNSTDIRLLDWLQIMVSLVLIWLVIHFFHVEMGIRLFAIMPAVVLGFGVYAWLPLSWRLPYLFGLNVLAIIGLMGWEDGSLLLVFGLGLFGLANLPVKLNYRIAFLLVAAVVLSLIRGTWLPLLEGKLFMPILGTMFMFRMVLYLYEERYAKKPVGFWMRLNYFFLLPNLVFTIFPIVDFQNFHRGYFARPSAEVYRKGVLMIANGVFHLLLYRFIYYYLVPAPSTVTDTVSLMHFLATTYALIVRLAGIFHFSAGVVVLFGFNLPPVFNHYFFADSFSDLWRRKNIYWRDFISKVFYVPYYFKLKRYGQQVALVGAVFIVFVINWFLHGFQWFWIRGSFLVSANDAGFWAALGILVAINSAQQSGRKPVNHMQQPFSVRQTLQRGLNVLGVFFTMSVLWFFWISSSVAEWWSMMQRGLPKTSADFAVPLAIVAGLLLFGILVQYLNRLYLQQKQLGWLRDQKKVYLIANLWLVGTVLFGLPMVQQQLEQRFALDLEPVRFTKMNAFDREQQYRGYYETLIATNAILSPLWDMEREKPKDWKPFHALGVSERRDDIGLKDLLPNQNVPFKRSVFTTNSLALRDREYSLEKPANTFRIALLGGSVEMGAGVRTEETFENLLEDYLNQQNLIEGYDRVEILNFAISGNHLFQNVFMCERRVVEFQPDAILYTAHSNEQHRVMQSLHLAYSGGRDLVFPYLSEVIQEAGLSRVVPEIEFFEALGNQQEAITLYGYERILQVCRELNAKPLWMYLPLLDDNEVPGERELLEAGARELGYHTLSLERWFDGEIASTLQVAPWDTHPNPRGHLLIAQKMLEQLRQNPELLKALSKTKE